MSQSFSDGNTTGSAGPGERRPSRLRRRTRRERVSVRPGPELAEMFNLTAYRIQLQMILDRLEGHANTAADEWTVGQRSRLRDAQRFLRAASTSLGRVLDLAADRFASDLE